MFFDDSTDKRVMIFGEATTRKFHIRASACLMAFALAFAAGIFSLFRERIVCCLEHEVLMDGQFFLYSRSHFKVLSGKISLGLAESSLMFDR